MAELRAVILDIDGTLLFSNDAHARAFIDAAGELGMEADFDTVRRLIGKGSDKLIPEAFGFADDSPDGERLARRKGEIFKERYLDTLQPTPGTRALLERFRADGLTLVVATSADADDLEGLLDRAGVRDLIEDATSSGDVEQSKPAPDVVEAAVGQAGCAPEEAVMLGDTPYDVEAATRAGVRIVAVRTGGWEAEDLAGAIEVFDDPAGVLAAYDRLPFGR